ncbi:MAG: RT0821/Lpp0805 family surface protein [Alphaproteobacteria bacterium]|nr:RT0821/Lpp0805 family surface protein [Alphaproteobacteria bacterium]
MPRFSLFLLTAFLPALVSCETAPQPSPLPTDTAVTVRIPPRPIASPALGTSVRPATNLGIVLGAWADPEIHAAMNDTDRKRNSLAERRAMNAPSGQILTWKSPASGNSGTIMAVKDSYNNSGYFCREFQQTVTVEGKEKHGGSMACQQGDGSWKIASIMAGS